MSFNEDKNNILKYISKGMKKNESKRLPNTSNAGYDVYNEGWSVVVSIDIRNYKEMVKFYKRWAIIRIIQSFTNSIISAVSDEEEFVDAYLNGDEVILVFRADTQEKISKIFSEYLVLVNSIANHLLPKLLKEHKYNYEFKAGVGCWLSNNNSLIKYGERRGLSFFTTIGDSINYSSLLAKKANKNGNPEILYNGSFINNLLDSAKNDHEKWGRHYMDINNSSIYGFSIRFNEYAE